ncbi:MFS transporter, partial [Campylobacter sp. US50a]|uniref:MFS transporter n=1 Tax=Campylobacter sp. US50a TaxID=2498122 RepID=UPI00141990C5
MLGRVMGVMTAGAMVAAPLGMIAVGPVLDALGLRGTFTAISVILAGVFLMVVTNRTIRTMDNTSESPSRAA